MIAASVMNSVSAIGRHIHDEHVADPPRCAQSGRRRGDGPHQLIGMQAALHQQLALGLANQFDGPGGGSLAVWHIDDFEALDVEVVLARHRRDLPGRPDQDRDNDAGFCRLGRPAQGSLVARMHHDSRCRRHRLGTRDQAVVFTAGGMGHRAKRSTALTPPASTGMASSRRRVVYPAACPGRLRPVAACGETASPPHPRQLSDCSFSSNSRAIRARRDLAFGVDIASSRSRRA